MSTAIEAEAPRGPKDRIKPATGEARSVLVKRAESLTKKRGFQYDDFYLFASLMIQLLGGKDDYGHQESSPLKFQDGSSITFRWSHKAPSAYTIGHTTASVELESGNTYGENLHVANHGRNYVVYASIPLERKYFSRIANGVKGFTLLDPSQDSVPMQTQDTLHLARVSSGREAADFARLVLSEYMKPKINAKK